MNMPKEFVEALAHAAQQEQEIPSLSRMQREAAIMDMRQILNDYKDGCRFNVGDLITPAQGAFIKWAGEPHLVIEVLETPVRMFDLVEEMGDVADPNFGARYDMRVLSPVVRPNDGLMGIRAYMAESWLYKPYEG